MNIYSSPRASIDISMLSELPESLTPNKQRRLNTYADKAPKSRLTMAKFSKPNIREFPKETQRRKALYTASLSRNRPYIQTELELFDALNKQQHTLRIRRCFRKHIVLALTGSLRYVKDALITNSNTGITTPTIYKPEKLVNINDYHLGVLYRTHLNQMERNNALIQLQLEALQQQQASSSTSPFAKLKGLIK